MSNANNCSAKYNNAKMLNINTRKVVTYYAENIEID